MLISGIGPVESAAVCVYGTNSGLDDECPLPCQTLLISTWGDCYKRHPLYKPEPPIGSGWFKTAMTTYDLFEFIATPSKEAPYATCRDWMMDNIENWNV